MNNLFKLLNDGHNPFIKGAVYRPMHQYGRGGLGYHPMRMIKGGSGTSTEIVVKPKHEISTITPRRLTTQEIININNDYDPNIPDIPDITGFLKEEEQLSEPLKKRIEEKKKKVATRFKQYASELRKQELIKAKRALDIQKSKIPELTFGIPTKISLNPSEAKKTKLQDDITDIGTKIKERAKTLKLEAYNEYIKQLSKPVTIETWFKYPTTKKQLENINNNDEVITTYKININLLQKQINEINKALKQEERRKAKEKLDKEIKDLTKKYNDTTKEMTIKHKDLLDRIKTLTKNRNDKQTNLAALQVKLNTPTKTKRSQETINNFNIKIENAIVELDNLEAELENANNELVNLEAVTEIDPKVNEIFENLLTKEKQLEDLLAGGIIPEAKPDYYETLIHQEEESNIQLTEEERNELVKSNLGSIIDTSIEYYTEKQNEYKNAPDFPELSEQNIEAYAKKYGIENNKAFEALSVRPDITAKIISLIDPSYKLSEIKNLRAINTGKANKDDKFGEIIDEKGKKRIFKKDDNAPFDLIVIFEYKGKTVKIVIEDKFYNNSNIHTTIKGVKGGKSVVIKYDELMNFTNNEYKKYKDVVLFRYSEAKRDYEVYKNRRLTDDEIKERKPELYNQYHGLRNKIYNAKNELDNDKITQEYFRDRYTAAIPMKMTKTNFKYPKEKLVKSGITNEDYYSYVRNKLTSGRKQVVVNDEGVITDIVNAGSETEPKTRFSKDTFEQIGYDLFIGAKILYCVSLKDALLGMNWSDMLANDPDLRSDPFYKFKPVATAYGPEKGEANTDSMGLTFNVFKVLARYQSSSVTPNVPVVSKSRTSRSNTSRSNISRVLDV